MSIPMSINQFSSPVIRLMTLLIWLQLLLFFNISCCVSSPAVVPDFEITLPSTDYLLSNECSAAFLRGPGAFRKVLESPDRNSVLSMVLEKSSKYYDPKTRKNYHVYFLNSFLTVATIKKDYEMIALLLAFGADHDRDDLEHSVIVWKRRGGFKEFSMLKSEIIFSFSAFEIAAATCDIRSLDMFLEHSKSKFKMLKVSLLEKAQKYCCCEFLTKVAALESEHGRIVPSEGAKYLKIESLTTITQKCSWASVKRLIGNQMIDFSPDISTGNTILHLFANTGNLDGIRYMYNARNQIWDLRLNRRVFNLEARNTKGMTALHSAIDAVHLNLEVTKYLISIGACIDAIDGAGRSVLEYAVLADKTEIVELLLEMGVVNLKEETYRDLLVKADCVLRFNIVRLLLKYWKNACVADANGDTLLHFAATRPALISVIPDYIKACKNLELVNMKGETALVVALKEKRWKIAVELIEHGADVNVRLNGGKGIIHLAVIFQDKFLFSAAIAHGADVNAQDDEGNTPLHLASGQTSSIYTSLLIEKHANLEVENLKHQTPFLVAVQARSFERVRHLCDHGANVYVCDHLNRNALNYAMEHAYNSQMQLFLLERGVNVNNVDSTGVPVIIQAFIKGRDTFKLISGMDRRSRIRPDLEIADSTGKTILFHAIVAKDNEIVDWILRHNVNLEVRDLNGFNALITACAAGNAEVVKKLLKHGGCDPNSLDNQRKPALFHAIDSEQVKIVRILIKYGAKASQRHSYVDANDYARTRFFTSDQARTEIRQVLKAATRYENLISFFMLD